MRPFPPQRSPAAGVVTGSALDSIPGETGAAQVSPSCRQARNSFVAPEKEEPFIGLNRMYLSIHRFIDVLAQICGDGKGEARDVARRRKAPENPL
jgi:hypothetical protein